MASSHSLSLDMLIRKMPYGPRRTICHMMDIGSSNSNWKALAAAIINPRKNEPRYSIDDIAHFGLEVMKGNSMTEAVLRDWGTQETTVQQLIDILIQIGRRDVIQEVMPEYLKQETQTHNPHSEIVGHHGEPPIGKDDDGYSASGLESGLKDMKIEDVTKSTVEHQQETTAAIAKSSDTAQIYKIANAKGVMDLCYVSLKIITSNFDTKKKLGEGGFGAVYFGRLPKTGEDVAVKVLKKKEDLHKGQFKNELQHLSSLKHNNILPPMGYSFDGPSYCLVYKYMPNGSLEDCLKNSSTTRCISWKLRLSIATDIALGISFLHSEKIVHRDIKSANVLLDENFVAKVADFGLVRNIGKDDKTHVTKIIIGSQVYMSREALYGDVSPSVDVYSYGVVLLELLTGLPASEVPTTQEDIVTYYQNILESSPDQLHSIVDKSMLDYTSDDVDSVYTLADSCLEYRKIKRISMEKLLSEIKRISKFEE